MSAPPTLYLQPPPPPLGILPSIFGCCHRRNGWRRSASLVQSRLARDPSASQCTQHVSSRRTRIMSRSHQITTHHTRATHSSLLSRKSQITTHHPPTSRLWQADIANAVKERRREDGFLLKKFKDDNIDRLHGSQWGHTEDAYDTYVWLCSCLHFDQWDSDKATLDKEVQPRFSEVVTADTVTVCAFPSAIPSDTFQPPPLSLPSVFCLLCVGAVVAGMAAARRRVWRRFASRGTPQPQTVRETSRA